MPGRDLRDRCSAVVDSLDLPCPFELEEFRCRLERKRDRSLNLVPAETVAASPCGLWVSLAEADYIFYDAGTTYLHQIHIILHEVGHMLLDHRGAPWVKDELAKALMPGLDSSLIQRMLGRTTYSQVEEQEAEMLASLILERTGEAVKPRAQWDTRTAEVAHRVESVFGGAGRRG